MTTPKVSIIVPVYNAQRYLQECLDSLYAQTMNDFEIITIDDGSTDGSLAVLQAHATSHKNLRIIKQTNHGQGYARNRALEVAQGIYVLFVDADDYIKPDLLRRTVTVADNQNADVVHFGWLKLINGSARDGDTELHVEQPTFIGNECEQFLLKNNYFSWDSLYRKALLDAFDIRFGEGYIYEDNEFIAEIASYAERIAFLKESLYVMRYDNVSSTRSGAATEIHGKDFLIAMKKSFDVFKPRSPYGSFYLSGYFLEKFIVYYERRVPRSYRKKFLRNFINTMHNRKIILPEGSSHRFLRWCIHREIFSKRRYGLFKVAILYKTVLLPHLVQWRNPQRK